MAKIITAILLIMMATMLTSCAPSELGSPCPNYGAFCKKQPVNAGINQ